MTCGQRKMHVLLWLVLGPIAVLGLVLAVVWRPAEPVQEGELPGVTTEGATVDPLQRSAVLEDMSPHARSSRPTAAQFDRGTPASPAAEVTP